MSSPRVGYVPYSADLRQPGDRRRFVHYARRRGIDFEIFDAARTYDVVVLSARADIGGWSRSPKSSPKLVFDVVDSYLEEPSFAIRPVLRGVLKYLGRETRSLHLNYRRELVRMLCRADAVVCSTVEQRDRYLEYCDNVHPILDIQTEVLSASKTDFGVGDTVHLVWEGLPYTLGGLAEIAGALKSVALWCPLELHVVTAPHAPRVMGRHWPRVTRDLAPDVGIPTTFYDWHPQTLAAVATACDLAVIPLPLDDPFAAAKSENKLLSFWRMGLPVLASATPAYLRTMADAGQALCCRTADEWDRLLRELIIDEDRRRSASQSGSAFAEQVHGEDVLLEKWDAVLESIL